MTTPDIAEQAMTTDELPALPRGQKMGSAIINGKCIELRMHDDDAMRAYARAPIAAYRALRIPAKVDLLRAIAADEGVDLSDLE